MIFDMTTMLSDNQAITANVPSTNTIDTGPLGTVYGATQPLRRDIGKGLPIPLLIQVTEAFNNLTSLQVQVQTDDTAAFASPRVVAQSPAIALADLIAGYNFHPTVVPEQTNRRYFRLNYIVVGTAPTAGKIKAGVVMSRQTNGV